jgi:hypothetical protein
VEEELASWPPAQGDGEKEEQEGPGSGRRPERAQERQEWALGQVPPPGEGKVSLRVPVALVPEGEEQGPLKESVRVRAPELGLGRVPGWGQISADVQMEWARVRFGLLAHGDGEALVWKERVSPALREQIPLAWALAGAQRVEAHASLRHVLIRRNLPVHSPDPGCFQHPGQHCFHPGFLHSQLRGWGRFLQLRGSCR